VEGKPVKNNATTFLGVCLATMALVAAGGAGSALKSRAVESRVNDRGRYKTRFDSGSPHPADAVDSVPLRFMPSQESSPLSTRFVARGTTNDVSLNAGVAVVSLATSGQDGRLRKFRRKSRVRVALTGSNSSAKGSAENGSERVRFDGVYPGIDLVYHGNQNELEYDFLVAAHADPRQIVVKLDGIDSMRLDAEGNIVLRAGQREIVQHKPFVYQEVDGVRHEVGSGFVVLSANQVGFELSPYDKDRELVIDPVLVYDGR